MPSAIRDEFAGLPISRQRKYQLRMKRDQRCQQCGKPVAMGSRCLKHLIRWREKTRRRLGLKRRYYNTLGYRPEAIVAQSKRSKKSK